LESDVNKFIKVILGFLLFFMSNLAQASIVQLDLISFVGPEVSGFSGEWLETPESNATFYFKDVVETNGILTAGTFHVDNFIVRHSTAGTAFSETQRQYVLDLNFRTFNVFDATYDAQAENYFLIVASPFMDSNDVFPLPMTYQLAVSEVPLPHAFVFFLTAIVIPVARKIIIFKPASM